MASVARSIDCRVAYNIVKIELVLPCLYAEHMPDGVAIDNQALTPWLEGLVMEPHLQHSYEKVILKSLGYNVGKGGVLPIANCLYVDPQIEHQIEHQVCVQPIHLEASHDNARLLPAQCLSLSAEESTSLIATLNELWNADDICITAHSAIDWQLTGQNATALDCLPPAMLAYQSVADSLPRSSEAAQWRRLLTEAQMLLHEHPVNIDRQQRGLLSVNSIWCFGGAVFSEPAEKTQTTLYANDPFTHGLAKRLSIDCIAVDDFNVAASAELAAKSNTDQDKQVLVADTRLQQAWLANEYDQFIAARDNIIQHLLQPINAAHFSAKHVNFHIDDCNGNQYESVQTSGVVATLKRVFSKWR